jgi:hypothetical protein
MVKWITEYQNLNLFSFKAELNGKNIIFPLVGLFARVGLLFILMGLMVCGNVRFVNAKGL